MPRIEILFDKESKQKPSDKTRNALQEQIIKRIGDRFGPLSLRVAMSSSQSLTISGTKTDDEKEEIGQLLEEIWQDDSWIPAWNHGTNAPYVMRSHFLTVAFYCFSTQSGFLRFMNAIQTTITIMSFNWWPNN
nr:DinI-like family protein [Providencia rettgeri]